MFIRKHFVIAWVAVATMMGAGTVYAAWDLDTDRGAFVVAKESVTGTQAVSSDTLYVVENAQTSPSPTRLTARVQLGVQIAASAARYVRFNFVDMGLTSASAPALALTGATVASAGGGSAGDNFVAFTVTAGGTAVPASTQMTLTLRAIAVKEGARGDIRMQVRGATSSTPVEYRADISDAIGLESALRESAAPATARSLVGEGFRKFESGDNVRGDGLAASVGQLSISASDRSSDNMLLVSAADGSRIDALDDLIVPATDGQVVIDSTEPSFGRKWEFADAVYWSDDQDCSTQGTNLRTVNSGVITIDSVSVADAAGKHLCVEVDGVTSIPRVGFSVTVTYTALSGAQFGPGESTVAMGSITRGGTSIVIPYLTTHSNFNHRIIIGYAGDEPVAYQFEFLAENHPRGRDTTPTARDAASGTLQPGVTGFRSTQLVEFTGAAAGWTRTAAVLTVDTSADLVNVISNQVLLSTGGTDTVSYRVTED